MYKHECQRQCKNIQRYDRQIDSNTCINTIITYIIPYFLNIYKSNLTKSSDFSIKTTIAQYPKLSYLFQFCICCLYMTRKEGDCVKYTVLTTMSTPMSTIIQYIKTITKIPLQYPTNLQLQLQLQINPSQPTTSIKSASQSNAVNTDRYINHTDTYILDTFSSPPVLPPPISPQIICIDSFPCGSPYTTSLTKYLSTIFTTFNTIVTAFIFVLYPLFILITNPLRSYDNSTTYATTYTNSNTQSSYLYTIYTIVSICLLSNSITTQATILSIPSRTIPISTISKQLENTSYVGPMSKFGSDIPRYGTGFISPSPSTHPFLDEASASSLRTYTFTAFGLSKVYDLLESKDNYISNPQILASTPLFLTENETVESINTIFRNVAEKERTSLYTKDPPPFIDDISTNWNVPLHQGISSSFVFRFLSNNAAFVPTEFQSCTTSAVHPRNSTTLYTYQEHLESLFPSPSTTTTASTSTNPSSPPSSFSNSFIKTERYLIWWEPCIRERILITYRRILEFIKYLPKERVLFLELPDFMIPSANSLHLYENYVKYRFMHLSPPISLETATLFEISQAQQRIRRRIMHHINAFQDDLKILCEDILGSNSLHKILFNMQDFAPFVVSSEGDVEKKKKLGTDIVIDDDNEEDDEILDRKTTKNTFAFQQHGVHDGFSVISSIEYLVYTRSHQPSLGLSILPFLRTSNNGTGSGIITPIDTNYDIPSRSISSATSV